jgi:tRNA(Arg) A34 adenosine deaminase TadA
MPRLHHAYFCNKAANLAKKSTMQHRHGCVIVYNDKEIVAQGYNHMQCTMENVFSIHAEVEAVNKFRQVLRTKSKDFINKCTLYVVRIGTDSMNNPLRMSEPCDHCAMVIKNIGIPKVCYSV